MRVLKRIKDAKKRVERNQKYIKTNEHKSSISFTGDLRPPSKWGSVFIIWIFCLLIFFIIFAYNWQNVNSIVFSMIPFYFILLLYFGGEVCVKWISLVWRLMCCAPTCGLWWFGPGDLIKRAENAFNGPFNFRFVFNCPSMFAFKSGAILSLSGTMGPGGLGGNGCKASTISSSCKGRLSVAP